MPPLAIRRPQLERRDELTIALERGVGQNAWRAIIRPSPRVGFALVLHGTGSIDNMKVLFSSTVIQVVHNGKTSFYGTGYSQVLILAGPGNDTIQLKGTSLPVTVVGGSGRHPASTWAMASSRGITPATLGNP